MRRFFFDQEQILKDTVELSEQESRHAAKVLRLQAGNSVELLDGLGKIYSGTIMQVGRVVKVHLLELVEEQTEPSIQLRVEQALLKGDKMDLLVQKCTELGVAGFAPFFSSRCQGKLSRNLVAKKHERWNRIGLEACKQSLRAKPMRLRQLEEYNSMLHESDSPGEVEEAKVLKIMFWEEEKDFSIADLPLLTKYPTVSLMLGPEGGFTTEEVAAARQHGYQTVSLGTRILRAETATLTSVSIMQHLVGGL